MQKGKKKNNINIKYINTPLFSTIVLIYYHYWYYTYAIYTQVPIKYIDPTDMLEGTKYGYFPFYLTHTRHSNLNIFFFNKAIKILKTYLNSAKSVRDISPAIFFKSILDLF